MNIKIKSKDSFTFKELYDLTKSPESIKLTKLKGQDLDIDSFILYDDGAADKVTEILSIKTVQGEIVGTNSPSFIRDFTDIITLCKESGAAYPTKIKISTSISKSGREYARCVYIA